MNKIDIDKEILSQINQRKNDAKISAINYLDYAYKFEDFADIDKKYRGLIIDMAKLEYQNEDNSKIKKEIFLLERKRYDIAKSHKINLDGFNEEYYYVCKKCGDTGYVNGEKCSCYKKLFNEIMFSQDEFNKSLPQLKNFDISLFDNEKLGKQLLTICEKYIFDFPNVPTIFTLQGAVGVGKSYLAQTIMCELIKKNYIIKYFTAFDFSKTLKDWHFSDMTAKKEFENIFFDCDLLIIDDLGTEPIYNNINYEYMQNIFDQRMYMKKPIIVITNADTELFISLYGERLYSRIFFGKDSKCYSIKTADIRQKLHNKKNK